MKFYCQKINDHSFLTFTEKLFSCVLWQFIVSVTNVVVGSFISPYFHLVLSAIMCNIYTSVLRQCGVVDWLIYQTEMTQSMYKDRFMLKQDQTT